MNSSLSPRGFIAAVTVAVALAALWLAAPAVAKEDTPLPIERSAYYAIKWDNQLIGWSRYDIERSVALAGDEFYVVNSAARLRLGAGTINDIAFRAKTLLNHASLEPSFFYCEQKQGLSQVAVECLFTPTSVAQKNTIGKDESSSTIPFNAPPFLLFNNVWGRLDTFVEHYSMLFAAWKARKNPSMSVYEPVLRDQEQVHIEHDKSGTVNVEGREVAADGYIVSDAKGEPMVALWISPTSNQILRLEDLRGGFTLTLSDPRVVALVEHATGVDLYKNRTQWSNVYLPNSDGLRSFKAAIDLQWRGRPALAHEVVGYNQTFNGKSDGGEIQGTVLVNSTKIEVKNSDIYPRRTPYSGALAAYLQAESGIESNDDVMKSKSEEVAWRSRTSWEAAQKINSWVHDKINDGYSLPSARYVLEHGQGNAEAKALLEVALLRAAGIPARTVDGLLFSDGNFVPHTWCEVYTGPDGWVGIDAATGESGTLGASHVAVAEHGDLLSMKVQVLDYAPRPAPRVAYFTKELAWPVGEQRVYSVMHGGKEIGSETARVKGLVSVDGHDAYAMDFSADLTLDGKHLVAKSTLTMTPDGLPLSYNVSWAQGNGATATRTLSFAAGEVTEKVKSGDKEDRQQTPVSEGTYLADRRFMSMWALVVGQLPNPQVGVKADMHVYDPETHTVDKVPLAIRSDDDLGIEGTQHATWRCESDDGVSFYIDKQTGQVLRIEQPRQDLVLQLKSASTKI